MNFSVSDNLLTSLIFCSLFSSLLFALLGFAFFCPFCHFSGFWGRREYKWIYLITNTITASSHVLLAYLWVQLQTRRPVLICTESTCVSLLLQLKVFSEAPTFVRLSAGQPRNAKDLALIGATLNQWRQEPLYKHATFPSLKGQFGGTQQDRTSCAHIGDLVIHTVYWLLSLFYVTFPTPSLVCLGSLVKVSDPHLFLKVCFWENSDQNMFNSPSYTNIFIMVSHIEKL